MSKETKPTDYEIKEGESRRCPECGMEVIKKNGKLYNGIKAFNSVHTTCENCNADLVCGYIQEENIFLIITEKEYEELNRS